MRGDPRFFYFAYGSNMLTRRMLSRTPSARVIGVARLRDHQLRWHKVSKDGSGKCDAVAEPGTEMLGVVYEIATADKPALDLAEGLGIGYREVELEVHTDSGAMTVHTYQATNIDSFTKPFDWYKSLVIAGAREHGLPQAYVESLAAVPAMDDWNPQRASENLQALTENA